MKFIKTLTKKAKKGFTPTLQFDLPQASQTHQHTLLTKNSTTPG